jgi:two-component system OmpR family sensor kinase
VASTGTPPSSSAPGPTPQVWRAVRSGWHRSAAGTSSALRRVRDFAERVPLRVRLVVAMLVIVAAAQVTTGVSGFVALDRYLMGRLDSQLSLSARDTAQQMWSGSLHLENLRRRDLPGTVYIQVYTTDGILMDAVTTDISRPPPTMPESLVPSVQADPSYDPGAMIDKPVTVHGTGRGDRWRVVMEPVDRDRVLIMAVSMDQPDAILTNLALIDAVVSVAVLVLLGGVGYLLMRASLRPLHQVETVAAEIAAGNLSRRVPDRDPRTEVGRLGLSFNAMLTRIEGAFHDREASEAQARASEHRMRRFIADASHELRTPLTSIRGFAELYRQGAATDEADVDRFMQRIETESSRMGLLVEDLLLLARLDQQRPLRHAPVDLAVLAADAVHDAHATDPDRLIELRVTGPSIVAGDEPRLRQVLGNLLTNALAHTPPETPVTVRVTPDGDSAVLLEVADEGPGMTPEQAARVFERFYRADPSRARQTGGTGLGLAIVAAIVAAHEGVVEVVTAPGEGAAFRVRLPVPAEPTAVPESHARPIMGGRHARPIMGGPPGPADHGGR